ncbi:hypothetical protein LUZ63_020068 [Rhynchospora breviuscula]|uniref:DNA (cytosine-5-)-methyltransferase n=1 Tax=Rhynchospora breviuscula TaxID=2022672 RepID=A0A9Q0C151_9POAL|nr:hypothetical protein LUZ63_020068 [Rhynchospora breviuscula]
MLVVLRRAQVEQTRRERDAILDVVCPPPADLTGTAPWLPRSGRPLPQQQRRGGARPVTLTLTDLFAGFGGASSGAVTVPGVELVIAANHWALAVEVHNSNHPDADHACVDLHLEDPAYFPSTDLLWASPECTQWSQANGKKPDLAPILGGWSLFDDLDDELKVADDEDAATRSRLLMFDVLRFIEHHRYRAGVVENVVDIARNPKYAAPWRAWQTGLRNLGYRFVVVPPPTLPPSCAPRGWCGRCDTVVETFQAWKPGRTIGKYRQQYVYLCSTPGCGEPVEPGYLPAASAIDWSLPGQRIGDRAKPLADKTRARIAAGIARYWSPIHVEAGGNQYDAADPKHSRFGDPNGYYRAWSVGDVLRTLHTAESKALAIPLEGRDGKQAQPMSDPFRTQTTRHDLGIVTPFIAELRGGGSTARSTDQPLSTVTASGNHHALLAPYYGNAETAQPVDQPVGTLTTRDRYALVMRNNSAKGGHPARHTTPSDEYLRTLTANGPLPSLLMRNNGSKGDGAEMVTPASEYLRTLTTKGHQSLLTPGDIEAAAAQVDDCLFRMLEPHEVGAGMAFDRDYIVLGTRRQQVKGYGNAVTPPAARDLVGCVAAALGGAA